MPAHQEIPSCSTTTPMLRYINLNKILDINNYINSLRGWEKLQLATKGAVLPTFYQSMFDKYIEIIKPIIYPGWVFGEMLRHKTQLCLYTTDLSRQQFGRLTRVLRNKYLFILRVLQCNLIGDLEPLNEFHVQYSTPPTSAEVIESPEIYFETPKSHEPIFKIEIHKKPCNPQLQYWSTTLPVPPISIKGSVVHGKGLGAKELGMPTANITITPQLNQKLLEYPNGIYVGWFTFLSTGKTYKGVMSLGFNPQYQNSVGCRKLEVYIYHDFKDTFYGAEVRVDIRTLIRFEGKFISFDSFLNAMHNDIQIGRNLEIPPL